MLTRRQLLRGSLALIPAGAMVPLVFRRAVFAAGLEGPGPQAASERRTLVVVQLKGGNDGLNTVVPYADGRYFDARAELAIADGELLHLDDRFGLHPSMAALMPFWDAGHLAIVQGVGYADQSYSHFRSMDIWQSADPTGETTDGWLGRYFAEVPPEAGEWFAGLGIGRRFPPSLYTPHAAIPAVSSVETYKLQGDPRDRAGGDALVDALRGLYAAAPGERPFGALLGGTMEAAYQSSLALQSVHEAYVPGAEYPDTPFARGLRLLAEAIVQDLGVRVGHVTQGGFDTHADQPERHGRLWQTVSQGLAAFYADLQAHEREQDVLIMTWSEFGRRVAGNASGGTDHGAAAPLFAMGDPVRGGLYGEHPDLGALDLGNLRYTVDFRSVYATALERWLGAPAELVLGTRGLETIPFLE